MGVHFVKFGLFDDRLEVDQPEALVYEQRNGRFQLVAVEYVTPAAAWEASHDDFDLPHLMGHLFHYAPGPNRYGPPRSTSCTSGPGRTTRAGPSQTGTPPCRVRAIGVTAGH